MNTTHHHRTRSHRFFPVALLVAGCAITLAHAPATAQDALGRGDALDANPGVGTGGRNLRIPTPDYRARNLLITGDVAGGRAFRDSVGYRADTDFRDSLGSDDLFRFRADTALSSPRFAGLGRVADQFRFGQDLAMLEYRRSPALGPDTFRPDHMQDFDRRLTTVPGDDRALADRFSERIFTVDPAEINRLRELQSRAALARPVGVALTEEGDLLIATASPLQGISLRDERFEVLLRGISDLDIARLREDARRGLSVPQIGMPHDPSFRHQLLIDESPIAQLEQDRMDDSRIDDSRVIDRQDSPHVEILKRIAQRYAGMDNVQLSIDARMLEELDDEFAALRETLQAMRSPRDVDAAVRDRLMPWTEDDEQPTDPIPPAEEPDADEPWRVDPLLPDRPDTRRPDPDDEDDDRRPRPTFDPTSVDSMIDLLRHGQTIDQLAPADGTRVNELILTGQSSLRRGDYFNAENRFARALRFEPGHPMASIGIVHAQLGAGLNQAAAVTLRQLLTTHPELIDARFDARLLPPEPRLLEVIESLDAELENELLGDQFGLLLAYLGHQRSDRTMVERGLGAMESVDPDAPLLPLLRGLWLAQDDDDEQPRQNQPNRNREPAVPPQK